VAIRWIIFDDSNDFIVSLTTIIHGQTTQYFVFDDYLKAINSAFTSES
jgi:hypothetical protein